MRADAQRNLELVLRTGARLLADDPSASIAAIAAAAGVDRRTVYRRFASRDELLLAVYGARYDAVEEAIEAARLREAPVGVALHRYVEGIVAVNRAWPVEAGHLLTEPAIQERRRRLAGEVEAFLGRAEDEGLVRPGLPAGWAASLLPPLMLHAAEDLPDLSPARAADVVVDTLLRGVGRR
ncbi:TetR/AcrR family transcriptional regulator [Actinomadura parmotrematis]|uniref:TetR/AcrR family transcriptional regulator n=1 Tax=Actinomadura parmotrematis TaxID=2864039 RepID=A0ABS7FVX1_9ACTN|nr:TetR/AcrR family transcriptional regulator [Actinomadura parmotrematis]MBW8484125.1 TetR/AcrR family transcriptional regulator [Actinomadura parmotrematis]